jgi:tRNA 2-selenouridine synthase
METLSVYVLIGKTGSGKTSILRCLNKYNLQILDLEHIAQNSGSVFGMHAHKKPAISQKEFNDKLLLQISLLTPNVPVITEWKGKKIGKFKIPDFLYSKLISAPKIEIERCEYSRIQELKEAYRHLTIEELYKCLFSLRSKFTENNFQCALEALEKKDKTKFIQTLLHYYDSSSEYSRLCKINIVHKINWNSRQLMEVCEEMDSFFRNHHSQ